MILTHHGINSISRLSEAEKIYIVGSTPQSRYQDKYYAPIYTSTDKYHMSELLYRSSEIGMSGLITDIEFNVCAYESGAQTPSNIKIYMQNTNLSQLSSTSVMMPANSKVFDGSITLYLNTFDASNVDAWTWTKFHLDTPFSYDSASNLLIVFSNSNRYASDNTKTYFATFGESNMVKYKSNSTAAYNVVSNTYYKLWSYSSRPCIRLSMQV